MKIPKIKKNTVFHQKKQSVIVAPSRIDRWKSFFNSLGKFSKDFMEERNQPEQQIREDIFK